MLRKFTTAASAFALATVLSSASAFAGTKEIAPPPVEAPAEEDPVSGTLALMVNTHFISYGADVWAAGLEWDDVLFNPSFELTIDLGGGFGFIIGTWWDVNDNADSNIGDAIQEVDVWAGLSYATGPLTFTLLYQEWMYASDSDRIVDFKVAFDTLFSPYILIHGRVDAGPTPDEGIVGVLGGSYGFEAGPVSFTIPASVAFATDDYFGGDGGFAYASTGLSASVPLPFLPGEWSFSAAVNYYYTMSDVYPSNPDENIVTGTTGLTLSF
jgi:hypothetical protein